MVPQAALPRLLPVPAHKPRPPTPPQEPDIRPYSFDRGLPKEITSQLSSNITPNSSAESPATATSRKKVNWPADGETTSSPIVPPLQAPGERKPIKSILKPYNGTNVQSFSLGSTTKLNPPHAYPTLAAMLESIAQQLAGDDRNSKMDAYTTLSGSIKASDNVPEIRALKEKMGILLQFMRRDLTARTTTGAWDTSLIVNNLVLLSSFLHKPAIAELLTSDFSAYLVDHAIKTFEDPTMSKDVVKHLMFILARQNFPAKIMNENRVVRLIKALHEIEGHVKGKSIVMGRLDIYKNFIRNSRSHMMANTDWLEDLFSDMLSSLKDTRTSAIELGLDSAFVLGTEIKATRAAMDLFKRESKDGEESPKFMEYFAGRLIEILKKKQDYGSSVPQIWSVPVLFLRSRPRLLEQWQFLNLWLGVIRRCFNYSDQQVNIEANLAWNRLIFALRLDESTSIKILPMLSLPLVEQLKRRTKSVNSSKKRKSTLSSICVLLYYAFRPNSTSQQLDLYWKEYVISIVGHTVTAAGTDITSTTDMAKQDMSDMCRILKALFDSTTPRPWKETRAMELGSLDPMDVSELPSLDSKWLRKSAPQVFPVLDPLLEMFFWNLTDDAETVTGMWKAYITSIAAPAVKEVKVANEIMSCIASIFTFLYRIWHIGPKNVRSLPASNSSGSSNFLGSFGKIITSTIEGVGPLPFTEKQLSIGGNQDTFIVIATPSHHPRNTRGEARCPLHHLVVLLTNLCPGLEYDVKYSHLVRQILAPFFNARPTSKAKLDLVKELLPLIPTETTMPCRLMWQVLADFATLATDTRDGSSFGDNGNSEQPLGAIYRSALKILEVGVELSPTAPLPGWQKASEALINSSAIDAGDGGRAIAVIEPLARTFVAKAPTGEARASYGLTYCRSLVSKATYPKDRPTLDAARKRLWGTTSAVVKGATADPFAHLYEFLRGCLENSYTSFTKEQSLQYADVLSATTGLLIRCPDVLLFNVLVKLQSGICHWILDDQSKLNGGTPLSQAVTSLWGRICSHLPHVKEFYDHSKILNDLEPLFCAGLESKHRYIVNSAIRLWNTTFGDCKDKLEYPPKVTESLLRLRPIADLQMPFFPESLETERSMQHRQPPSFPETQDGSNFLASASMESMLRKQVTPQQLSPFSRIKKFKPQVVIQVAQSISTKRHRDGTPEPVKQKSKTRTSTPRLRHDDSQIQFEAIESSPIVDTVADSQLLTDRQKEVKERQKTEAAMFPDIRSSPRSKGKQAHRRSSSVELPFHRSSSKSRRTSSPTGERETTPIVAPQADDDFVASSPTPSRALSGHGDDEEDPPSSPPAAESKQEDHDMDDDEVASSHPATESKQEDHEMDDDDDDIPSSPPEMPEEPENDTTTSVDPSAQLDPYGFQNDRTISTFEFTPDEPDKSTIADSFAEVKPSEMVSGPAPTAIQADGAPQDKEILEAPNTPERQGTPAAQQTPKTPVFHDARQSPTSSDVNGEVFEDAISSPRLNLEATKEKQASSPLSELDESSMMRIMTEFDQGSGRPKRSVKFSADRKNEVAEPESKTPTLLPSSIEPPLDSSTGGLHKEPQDKVNDAMDIDEHPSEPTGAVQESSSIPSLVPETLGVKAPKEMIIAEGEEFDPEDTIIVEVPEDYDPFPMHSKRRKTTPRKRTSLGLGNAESPAPKRRKQGQSDDRDEVPDSQGAEIRPVSSSQGSQANKARGRPGRPRRSNTPSKSHSQSQSQIEMSQESEPEQNFAEQSFTSVDLDAPVPSSENPQTTDALVTTKKKVPDNESDIMETALEALFDAEHDILNAARVIEQTTTQESFNHEIQSEEPSTPDVEVIKETIIENSLLENSSDAAVKPEVEEERDITMADVPASEPAAVPEKEHHTVDAIVQTDIPEITPAQSLKERLQSLIGDLGSASLTKEEVNTFEDMFMDAKEQLYGARRRGRTAGL